MAEYERRAEEELRVRSRARQARAKELAQLSAEALVDLLRGALVADQLTEIENDIRLQVGAWLADAEEFGRVPKRGPDGSLRGEPQEPLPPPTRV